MPVSSKKSKLIVVAGPTASGKTAFAIKLAKDIDGEIINADSRQVYKFMNIGTNKGVIKAVKGNVLKLDNWTITQVDVENSKITGWLFDILTPEESFDVADYQFLARGVIKNINNRGKTAILVGGTGLYIDAVVQNYNINDTLPNLALREKLKNFSLSDLQEEFQRLDSEFFHNLNNSEKNNARRLTRMIEKLQIPHSFKKEVSDYLEYEFFYLDIPREILYKKINTRAEIMFKQGFVEEVKSLIRNGYRNSKPMQGMGYREVLDYLDGNLTLEKCIDKTKQAHRNYAKRQITWFKNHQYRNSINLKEIF